MQLYALDELNSYVNALWAVSRKDYICPECGAAVRLRSGPKVQPHFYHYRGLAFCRQREKSPEHLFVQQKILESLPQGEARMEVHFREIGRVADVAWEAGKVIFEVQYSPMTPEEALARTADYHSLGWNVVWILHDARYNQEMQSSLEEGIAHLPHYYTDMDALGRGGIYDQLVMWREGRKYAASPPREIEEMIVLKPVRFKESAPQILQRRGRSWSCCLQDDYGGLYLCDAENPFWQEWTAHELGVEKNRIGSIVWRLFKLLVCRPYSLLLQSVLETYSMRR